MTLDSTFAYRGKTRRRIAKQQNEASRSARVRRSYETSPDGTRKWTVSIDSSEGHFFDSFEEAMDFMRSEGAAPAHVEVDLVGGMSA